MPALAEKLTALQSQAVAVDGGVEAKMRDESELRLRFLGDSYPDYQESHLGGIVSRLLTDLAAEHQRGRTRIMDDSGLTAYDSKDRPHWHKPTREFMAERDSTVVAADSPSGMIRVVTKGMREFKVALASGTVNQLSETEFCRELQAAMRRLSGDYRAVVLDMREAFHAIPGNANPTRG